MHLTILRSLDKTFGYGLIFDVFGDRLHFEDQFLVIWAYCKCANQVYMAKTIRGIRVNNKGYPG